MAATWYAVDAVEYDDDTWHALCRKHMIVTCGTANVSRSFVMVTRGTMHVSGRDARCVSRRPNYDFDLFVNFHYFGLKLLSNASQILFIYKII